jgi:drug/metabolite transporter (DMT)-like permease
MPNRGSFKIIIGSILFGLIPLFVRYGSDLSIASIALGRAVFASIFARFYLYFTKETVSFKIDLITTKKLIHFLNWTFFLTLAIVFYFLSIQSGSIALAGVLMGAHPIFVVLFVYLFFKERIRKKTFISCFLSIIGIVLISGFTSEQSSTSILSSMYALGSAFFLGLNFTYYLKYLKGFSAGKLVFYQNVLQIPLLIPFAVNNPGTFSSSGIIAMICLGVLCTGIAYFLVYSGSQSIKKQYIGVLQIIENVIPILFGVLLFKEVLTFQMILGMVILFASILIISFEVKTEIL